MDPLQAHVARTSDGLNHVSTLAPGFEVRRILVAQGKEFNNGDAGMHWSIPDILTLDGNDRMNAIAASAGVSPDVVKRRYRAMARMPAVPLFPDPTGGVLHISLRQGVVFSIKVVKTKTEFVSAMRDSGVLLIYSGHARFGRGPCFGSGGKSRGEEWEEGHGPHPNADGIFRMGYPFLSVPADEPIEHGYTANLVSADITLARADCDPDLRPHLGGLRARTLAQIEAATAGFVQAHNFTETFSDHVRDRDPDKKWWTHGGRELHVVLHAHWQNTTSTPDDVGSFDPSCRVFCHFGCSTYKHNYPVVRKLKGWTQAGNERYAYWTTNLSEGSCDIYWLQSLLTYPEFNAFEPWEKSLAYAVRKTNAALGTDRETYRII